MQLERLNILKEKVTEVESDCFNPRVLMAKGDDGKKAIKEARVLARALEQQLTKIENCLKAENVEKRVQKTMKDFLKKK